MFEAREARGDRTRMSGMRWSWTLAGVAGALVVGVWLAVLGVASLRGASSSRTPARAAAAARARVARAYGRLPLAFEANRGQTDRRVAFLAHGPGYGLFFTSQGPVLALRHSQAAHSEDVVRLRFLDASARPDLVGVGQLPGVVNYLIGSNRSRWRTDIPTFSRLRYEGVWPGVSVDFYGNGGALEYDVRLAPGADPARIALAFAGARSLHLTSSGGLRVGLSQGTLLQRRPVAYQWLGSRRQPVTAGYQLSVGGRVRLRLAAYDHHRALIVDPGLVYSTYLGGSGFDIGEDVATDSSGDAYVTGRAESVNFPTTAGSYQPAVGAPRYNGFVTKLDPSGSVVYSTYIGGNGDGDGAGIAVDSTGAAYVAGVGLPGLPTTPGAFQAAYGGGGEDCYVAKLNPAGSGLVYSTFLGGSGTEQCYDIAVDKAGDAYVTGLTTSTNFPTTVGAFQTTFGGGSYDVFVTKLNPLGTGLLYSTYLGGSNLDIGYAIAVDATGSAYVGGTTSSTNFPTTAGAYSATFSCCGAFVAKVNPLGSGLVYSTFLPGAGAANGIAVDSGGSAYVTGSANRSGFPTTPGAFQTSSASGGAYVTKFNPTGSALVYSTYLAGSSGNESGGGIAVDSAGDAYVTGHTASTDFPTTTGAFQTSFGGGSSDAFMTKFNAAGSNLLYSTYLGGSDYDLGTRVAADASGDALVTGLTASSNFPTTPGAFQTTFGGNYDAFVAKIATGVSDPAISAQGTTFGATEGAGFSGTVATFTDPDTSATAAEYSARIDWGDGSSSAGTVSGPKSGSFTVSGSHTYAEEGTFSVRVTITDADNPSNSATASSTGSVADAALHSACAAPAVAVQAFAGPTAKFTDDDPGGMSSDYSATIDWGDSSSSSGTVSPGAGSGPYAVSGSHVYRSTGTFTITTTITDAGGSQTVAKCKTLVFAFPVGGSFVIGDLNSTVGMHVLFWGAQWTTNNTLSGGPAPSNFKGFEDDVSPPKCGTNWSTDPGNSAPPPPAPLPPYMGVIVSSTITQAPPTVGPVVGDTKHIVVVQTDPGYQPDPSHPGTGTIVAQVC